MRTLLLLLLLSGLSARAQAPFLKLYYDQDTLYWNTNVVIEAANGDVVEVGRLVEVSPDTNYLVFRRFDSNGTLLIATRVIPLSTVAFEIRSGLELPDGSFLLFGSDFPQAAVVRLDAQGNLLSVQRRNGNSGYYHWAFWENDSTILALGGEYFLGQQQLLLSWFDSAGAYLGSQGFTIDGLSAEGIMGIRCVAGGVLIAAQGADTLGNGSFSTSARTCLLRLDDAGDVLWAKRYIRPGHIFYPSGMVENDDGSVLIGGGTWITGAETQCTLMHVDAQGDTLSAHVLHDVLDPGAGFYPRGFMANTDTSVMFTGFLLQGSYMLSCDRAGTPLTAARFTATHTIDTPVRSMYGDLLVPVAGTSLNGPSSGVALGIWRTADPYTLSCSEPITIATTTPDLLIGQGYAVQPVNVVFDDITAQCTQSVSVMTAFDSCLGTAVALQPGPVAEVRIWPVPATDRVSVSASAMERIDILDTSGRTMLSTAAHGAPAMEMDITGLASGPYHVRIATGTGVHVRQIVKE